MRYLTVCLICLIVTVSASVVSADALLVCPQATGNPAPALVFEQREGNTSDPFSLQILNYLNITGTSAGLQEAIDASVTEDFPTVSFSSQVLEADFTGDNITDLLVNVTAGYGAGFNTTFSLFSCSGDHFVYLDNWYSGGWGDGPVDIDFAVDINNNQRRDLAFRITTVEGQKLHESLYILEWDGSEFAPIFQLGPSYGSYRDITIFNLDDDPATMELNIGYFYAYEEETATAFIEYINIRPTASLYQWNGEDFDFLCRYFDDNPNMPLLILHSAETLRACGFYDRAELYYEQLWNTRSYDMRSWDDDEFYTYISPTMNYPESVEDRRAYAQEFERAYYEAFAGYRLLQIHLHYGRMSDAERFIHWLQSEFSPGQHGYVYAAMAFALWDNFQETGDLELACQEAEAAFNLAYQNGDNPEVDYYEETYNGTLFQFGFYFANGRNYGANPDNLFAVPEDIDGMVSTPICL